MDPETSSGWQGVLFYSQFSPTFLWEGKDAMKIFPHREGEVAMKTSPKGRGGWKSLKCLPDRWVGFLRPTHIRIFYPKLLFVVHTTGCFFCWCRFSPSHTEFISESFFLYSRPSNRSWNEFRMTSGPDINNSITYGVGEKLPHKTPPYFFLGK